MKAPDPLARRDENKQPTDDFSPGKIIGTIVMVLAVLPVPLFFLEIGPEIGVWELLALVAGLGVIGAALVHGRGAAAFDRFVDKIVAK